MASFRRIFPSWTKQASLAVATSTSGIFGRFSSSTAFLQDTTIELLLENVVVIVLSSLMECNCVADRLQCRHKGYVLTTTRSMSNKGHVLPDLKVTYKDCSSRFISSLLLPSEPQPSKPAPAHYQRLPSKPTTRANSTTSTTPTNYLQHACQLSELQRVLLQVR